MNEVHDAFNELLDLFGGTHNREYTDRVRAVPIDGVPLGAKPGERRRPRSSFYSQSYLEALATARVLVQLGLDREVVNVIRRDPPMPDVEVRFRDHPPVYIEHTNVAEFDGLSFARHREELNLALEDCRAENETFRKMWVRGSLTIKMADPGVGLRPEIAQTADEIVRFSSGLDQHVSLLKPSAALWPALAAYRVNAFYYPDQHPNSMVCQEDAMAIELRPSWVGCRIADAVACKRKKKYDASAKPVWLLVTVDAEYLLPDVFPALVKDGVKATEIAPFARVVVWASGCEIALFE